MYTSAKYKNDPDGNSLDVIEVVKDGVTWWIPTDTTNRDYVAIKAKHDDPEDDFSIQGAD